MSSKLCKACGTKISFTNPEPTYCAGDFCKKNIKLVTEKKVVINSTINDEEVNQFKNKTYPFVSKKKTKKTKKNKYGI